MSIQDYIVGQICTNSDFPPSFAPLISPSVFREKTPSQMALNLLSSGSFVDCDYSCVFSRSDDTCVSSGITDCDAMDVSSCAGDADCISRLLQQCYCEVCASCPEPTGLSMSPPLTPEAAAAADQAATNASFPTCPSVTDSYQLCLLDKCCSLDSSCSGSGGTPDEPAGPCPNSPGECDSGCCCCDSATLAEGLRNVRVYDYVGASCNFDGSGPAPGETFPAGCTTCTDACDLVLQNQCNQLWTLPWWDAGPRACVCSCAQEYDKSYTEYWLNAGGLGGYISNFIDSADGFIATGMWYTPDGGGDPSGVIKWNSSSSEWETIATISEVDLHVKRGHAFYTTQLVNNDGLYLFTNEASAIKTEVGITVPPGNTAYDLSHSGIINSGDTGIARAYPYIAKYWDGTSWDEIGRTDAIVTSFTCLSDYIDNVLYMGLRSTAAVPSISVAGVAVNIASKLAAWDGTTFTNSGLAITGDITALYSDGTFLYIATTVNVYRYQAVPAVLVNLTPTGITGTVNVIYSYGGNILIGGNFSIINSVSCENVAIYSGGAWSEFFGGVNGAIECFAEYKGFLFVGGKFTKAGGLVPATNIARFDGDEWCEMPGLAYVSDYPPTNPVLSLIEYSGYLRAGGSFDKSGELSFGGDAYFYSELPSCGMFQSDCALHCAVCGKCNASVSVQNNSCSYEFTVSPSSECCREAEYEKILIKFWNHGSAKFLNWQGNYIGLKCQELNNTIQDNEDRFIVQGTCSLTAGLPSDAPCIQCYDGTTVKCTPCPTDCCNENLSNIQFLKVLADDLCSLVATHSSTTGLRSEFVIFVHGFASRCEHICPCKPGDFGTCSHNQYVVEKINDSLRQLNGRIHVVNIFSNTMLPPCEPSTTNIVVDFVTNCSCPSTSCTSDGVIYNNTFSGINGSCYQSSSDTCNSGCYGYWDLFDNCDIAAVYPVGWSYDLTNSNDTAEVDALFTRLTTIIDKPPASCQCTNNETYSIVLDSRNCSNQVVQIAGTSIVVGAPEGRTVCCDQIGCYCSTECPPFWYDPKCTQPPECKCGVECMPTCNNGNLLFDSLESAVEANWAHCCMHANNTTPEDCMSSDYVFIDTAQPWEDPNIIQVSKDDLKAQIETEWENCGGGKGGGGDDDEDEDFPPPPPPPGGIVPGEGGPGPVDLPGCGVWPPSNIDCSTDIIIGQESGTVSVRHPDVVVLNNGIGLVAYEDTADDSVIKIKQLHTSIQNKVQPNRKFRYGRMQNPVRWSYPPAGQGFAANSAICKLYYYEPIGDIATASVAGWEDADILFFITGPFRHQIFTIWESGIDDTGEYISLVVPSTSFTQYGWSLLIKEYGSDTDDRYDVQWITYDSSDGYDADNSDGDFIGSATVPDGVDPDLDATVSDVDAILELPPHYYNGQKVPVAYPSITKLDNYDNQDENSHYVYVVYQALEDSKWKVYIRQLRLSEYKKSADVLLVESNLVTLDQADITSIKWTCRNSCLTSDCDTNTKVTTIASVWTAETNDGIPVYNGNLPLGSNSVCGQSFPKNVLTVMLWQKTTWSATDSECPDQDMVMDWKAGDEITTAVPVFSAGLDQDEINIWARNNFNTGFPHLPVNGDITTEDISAQISYHPSRGGTWGVFSDTAKQTLTKYKGLYVSDPILVHESEGHCTRPVIKSDYNNKVFVAFEETIGGLQQIKFVGTMQPENLLPIGYETEPRIAERFDGGFNFFYDLGDFSYVKQITSVGMNQHPRLWIDLNNVVHLTWHSDKDNRWEIYYTNSGTGFSPARITNYDSKSLNPDIVGNDTGNMFIVWHDNRFGPWEIMIAPYEGERIKPLYQQNEYLSSIRNRYTHSINFVPILITNETNDRVCFKDIIVNFYSDRLLHNKKFTVMRSVYPFAFSERFDLGTGANEALTLTEYCVDAGETKEFVLSLTPDIFINPQLSSNSELTVGLKENKTYFTSVSVITTTNSLVQMPVQYQSTSCSDCTGLSFKYDYSSCVFTLPIVNGYSDARYVNAKLEFYTDSTLENLVATIEAAPGKNLDAFAIKGERADSLWGSTGFKLEPDERIDLQCYPALSKAHGLICGITYFIKPYICYGTSSSVQCTDYVFTASSTEYWICNCQSVRWTEGAPVPISDVDRWTSSGYGYSDTRVTISPGNSLNPKIKISRSGQGIIIYQDDRHKSEDYRIYGSVFLNWPNYKMRASGTMRSSDIFEGKSLIWEAGGTPEIMGGQNPVFDIDFYGNTFLAYESNQTQVNKNAYGEQKAFNDNTQSTIVIHKCGYLPSFGTNPDDPCSTVTSVPAVNYITGHSAPDLGLVLSQIIKQIRVSNDYVKYHVTYNKISVPVVKNIKASFDIIGTPDVVAIRFRNENSSVWSSWISFSPSAGDYFANIPWQLSYGNGLKTVYFQVATYQGLATSASMTLIADYDTVDYSVNFYTEESRTSASKLSLYNNLPVASMKNVTAETQTIYIDILPSVEYLSSIDTADANAWPKFSVFTQGSTDVLYKSVDDFVISERGNAFEGQFDISGSSLGQDGMAMVVPHFVNDPSSSGEDTRVEINEFNIFSDKSASDSQSFDRDEFGRIKYAITSRTNEDPYFVFGDPNYRLHKDN